MSKSSVNFLILFSLFFSGFYSILFLHDWSYDLGDYYAMSMFWSKDFQLYTDSFHSKGILYMLFIKIIGSLIGWGIPQVYLTLFLTTLLLFLSVTLSLRCWVKSFESSIVIILILAGSFYMMKTNSSIAIFQSAILICFLNYLFLFDKNKSTIYLFLSVTLFLLSINTRIDSLIYSPLILIFIFKNFHRENKIKLIVLPILVLSFSLIQFGYIDFNDYVLMNFDFNQWYKETIFTKKFINYFYRPTHFIILSRNLLLPIFLIFVFRYFSNIYTSSEKRWDFNSYLIFLAPLFSIIAWFITASDKDYHVFILFPGLLFLIIYLNDHLQYFFKYINKPIILHLLIVLIFTLMQPLNILFEKSTKIFDISNDDKIKMMEKAIEDIKANNNNAYFIGGDGWPHIISKVAPKIAINNHWLYVTSNPFEHYKLVEQHKNLISNRGQEFWIYKPLISRNESNKYFEEILNKSDPISLNVDNELFIKYKIK